MSNGTTQFTDSVGRNFTARYELIDGWVYVRHVALGSRAAPAGPGIEKIAAMLLYEIVAQATREWNSSRMSQSAWGRLKT